MNVRVQALLPIPLLLLVLTACAPAPSDPGQRVISPQSGTADADDLLVVDCLLPGQVRRIGQLASYVSRRRPLQTTARDCRIRGGEYVAHDPASYGAVLRVWLTLAEQGDREARTIVGELYEKGAGGSPDYRSAARWYREAAEAGDARAQINLGHLYEKGLGVAKDPAAALRWYRQAMGNDVALDPQTLNAEGEGPSALRDELARSQRELGGARERMDRLRAKLDVAQQKMARLEREVSGESASARRQHEREIERLRKEVQRLRNETSQAPPPVAMVGPSIQILDPPLTAATRGIKLVLMDLDQGPPERTIVGQVTAPAGILSVTVDGRETPVNEGGVFKKAVRLKGESTEVTVVAVDRLGERARVSFVLEGKTTAVPSPSTEGVSRATFGRYHALVVGNDRYTHWPDLKTAVADAHAVADILEAQYGFQVQTLENVSRYAFLSALADLGQRLTTDDNLLLYYAGHGDLDRVNNRGHWLPIDAERDNKANWISNVDVTDHLNIMRARQILVVADSCYSGALTRSALAQPAGPMTDAERLHWLKVMAGKRSRTVLTSGGLGPVLDIGGGEHSVFAKALLEVLQANRDIMEGRRLHLEVAARVTRAAAEAVAGFEQIPDYAPIRFTGHDGGDFFLIARGALNAQRLLPMRVLAAN